MLSVELWTSSDLEVDPELVRCFLWGTEDGILPHAKQGDEDEDKEDLMKLARGY